MQIKAVLFLIFTMYLSCTLLNGEATIRVYYLKKGIDHTFEFRVMAKGLEANNVYVVAAGTASQNTVNLKDEIQVPQGMQLEKKEKSFIEKDIARINPSIKELRAEGFEIRVQQTPPDEELRYVLNISNADLDKLRAEKTPLYLYISRQFAPEVFYIVDYYEIKPMDVH